MNLTCLVQIEANCRFATLGVKGFRGKYGTTINLIACCQ